jgi:DNA topoisomerase IB
MLVHVCMLVHASDAEPGIRRQRRGNGFRYVTDAGKLVRDRGTPRRIRAPRARRRA